MLRVLSRKAPGVAQIKGRVHIVGLERGRLAVGNGLIQHSLDTLGQALVLAGVKLREFSVVALFKHAGPPPICSAGRRTMLSMVKARSSSLSLAQIRP